MPATRQVRVLDLREADSPRAHGLDHDHVRLLAGIDRKLPPITVHQPTMRVVDGMHRLAAAKLNGQIYVEAKFVHGDLEEAFRLGVEANVAHGLPLSLADRRAAAARIVKSAPVLSDRSVARTTGLSAATVAAIRARVADHVAVVRIGVDGRTRPLTAEAGRIAAGQIIARRPEATVREIAREARVSVGTAHDVRRRVLAGEHPLLSTSRPAAPRPVRQPGPTKTDLEQILNALRQDPTLRYSDAGRSLLRWLDQHVISLDQWHGTRENVPPHCLEKIAKFAEECARRWMAVGEEIAST